MEHGNQPARGSQSFTGCFPGRPISRILFPIGKDGFIAPVRQLLHGFSMRRSRHKRPDRLIVPPHRQRPERKPFGFSHSNAEIARRSFRLPDGSPGVPKEPREKAQRTQAKSGDGDDCHTLSFQRVTAWLLKSRHNRAVLSFCSSLPKTLCEVLFLLLNPRNRDGKVGARGRDFFASLPAMSCSIRSALPLSNTPVYGCGAVMAR
ncbi:MAG: hypothetical protein K0Q83_3287 [Deltaproteobacteria bacterium]|jgi:hypothetical protein|nr:hypothetical protein [Deltaproteobacteria bacterium]